MRRHRLGVFAIVAVAVAPHVVAQTPRGQAAAPAAVSGVVSDGATNQPLAGAFVEIARTEAGRTITKRVTTDSRGRFVFTELGPALGYWLTGGATGYASSDFGWEPGASDAFRDRFTFRLADGEWKRDVAMRLWRRGTISGRVTDELGQPVVGVTVRAYSIDFIGGVARIVPGGVIAATDDQGFYRLTGLTPAQYKVGVMSVQSTVPAGVPEVPQERAIGAFAVGLRSGNGSNVSSPVVDGRGSHRIVITNFATPPPPIDGRARVYPAVFYPGVRSLTDAEPVAVAWGSDRTGVDFRLQATPAFVVAGRLEGAVIGPMLLRLMPMGLEYLPVGSEVATTVVEKDGAFTFLNVPAGSYTLLGQGEILEMRGPGGTTIVPDPPGFPARVNGGGGTAAPGIYFIRRQGEPTQSFVRRPVAVAGDVSDLIIPASSTSSIRGRVIYSDGSLPPLPNTYLPISLEPLDGDPSLGSPSAYVDAAATFAIDGVLPGKYRLSTGRVISSITWRGRDVTTIGIEVAAGETVDDIAITFTGTPARITATVTGLAGDARAAVIVFPAARDQWANYGWNPQRIASANTDDAGVATFARLPAGDYLVVAVEASKASAWVDPRFLAAASASAARVSVGLGETKPVTLKVERVVVR